MNIYLVLTLCKNSVRSVTAFLDRDKASAYASKATADNADMGLGVAVQMSSVTIGWRFKRAGFLGLSIKRTLTILGAQERA